MSKRSGLRNGRLTRSELSSFSLLAAFMVLGMVGCGSREPITSYTVDRDDETTNASTTGGRAPDSDRMIVGIAIHDGAAWFFKLAGEKEQITEVESDFRDLFTSIAFEDSSSGVPRWSTPEGWVREPGNAFRFASLKVNDQLKVSISTLQVREDLDSYLRANVDRWRREMGNGPVPEDDSIFDSLEEVEVDWGRFFILDQVGVYSGGAMRGGGAPFAGQGGGARQPPEAPSTPQPKVEEFKIPTGWETAAQTSISLVSLGYESDEGKAGITITALNAAGNTWRENVIRWAGIVGESTLDDDSLVKYTEMVTVDGTESQMIVLPFAGNESPKGQSIVAVMVVKGPIAWFIRLSGDSAVVESQLEGFRGFLQTIKFAS